MLAEPTPSQASIRFESTVPEHPSDDQRVVPTSVGAAVLAGAVVGVVQLALSVRGGMPHDLQLGPLKLDLGASAIPIVLVSTLWAGGRAAFVASIVVHGILRRLKRIGFLDYALVGAAVGLVLSAGMHLIGLGRHDWVADTALGFVAGGLYRLFAGAVYKA